MPIQFSYKLTDTDIYTHLMYRIHKKDAEKFDAVNVLRIVEESVKKFNEWLRHKECNILIYADSFATIPEQGVGGRCGEADTILIFIDPDHEKGAAHNIKEWLPSAIAHELYHARRYASFPVASTLGEALVEEGLPTLFEEFTDPELKVPYAHHLDKAGIADAWRHAKPLLDSEKFNRDDWFYGGGGTEKWTGYSLGYDVVKEYMVKKGIQNPAEIVDVSAEKVLAGYGPEK